MIVCFHVREPTEFDVRRDGIAAALSHSYFYSVFCNIKEHCFHMYTCTVYICEVAIKWGENYFDLKPFYNQILVT